MNRLRAFALASSLGGLAILFSCSDDDGHGHDHPVVCDGTGGKVSGPIDTHCGSKKVAIDPQACKGPTVASTVTPLHMLHDGGHEHDGGTDESILSNDEGDDVYCKYHAKWTSTEVCTSKEIFFTVTLTSKVDDAPVQGSPIRIEAYLDETHPAPNPSTLPTSTETSTGVYRVGPVRLDHPGRWTVRFHFHEECNETETSPHGHAAFYVAVP